VTQRSRSAGILLVLGVIATITGACTDSTSGSSWVDEARAGQVELPDVGDGDLPATVGCEPLGVDEPAFAAPSPGGIAAGTVDRGTGNDPYTATGARQRAGPDMVRSAPPAAPVSVVVARPVDPDEHVAARQADGVDTGPVPPSRYEPGRGSPDFAGSSGAETPTSTTSAGASDDEAGAPPAPVAPCVPVLGP
jgi:hypothetical protein